MKLMKKMKWLLVVAVMLVGVFGVSSDVRAEDYENEKISGDFRYVENEDGTIAITGYDGNNDIKIPSELDNKIVTAIYDLKVPDFLVLQWLLFQIVLFPLKKMA